MKKLVLAMTFLTSVESMASACDRVYEHYYSIAARDSYVGLPSEGAVAAGTFALSSTAAMPPVGVPVGVATTGIVAADMVSATVERDRLQSAIELINESKIGVGLSLSEVARKAGKSTSETAEIIVALNQRAVFCSDRQILGVDEITELVRNSN